MQRYAQQILGGSVQAHCHGQPLQCAANRRYLQQALRLGFRLVLITGPDKPLMCQEGKRMYVLYCRSVLQRRGAAGECVARHASWDGGEDPSHRGCARACRMCRAHFVSFASACEKSVASFRRVRELRAKPVGPGARAPSEGASEVARQMTLVSMEKAPHVAWRAGSVNFSRLEEQLCTASWGRSRWPTWPAAAR